MQPQKLVRMANQIAANFDYGPDKDKAVAGTVDHLRRFWTPVMREEIVAFATSGEAELNDVASRAVEELAEEQKATA
jgi:formate dehydrogenase subunit delta